MILNLICAMISVVLTLLLDYVFGGETIPRGFVPMYLVILMIFFYMMDINRKLDEILEGEDE